MSDSGRSGRGLQLAVSFGSEALSRIASSTHIQATETTEGIQDWPESQAGSCGDMLPRACCSGFSRCLGARPSSSLGSIAADRHSRISSHGSTGDHTEAAPRPVVLPDPGLASTTASIPLQALQHKHKQSAGSAGPSNTSNLQSAPSPPDSSLQDFRTDTTHSRPNFSYPQRKKPANLSNMNLSALQDAAAGPSAVRHDASLAHRQAFGFNFTGPPESSGTRTNSSSSQSASSSFSGTVLPIQGDFRVSTGAELDERILRF